MQPGAKFSDLLLSHWPNAEFLRRSLFDYGQFPLWNPQIISGAPFAADPLAGLWYPPNWLTVILPLPFAFNLLFALHLAWGGWGMYCWARADGFGFWPAFVGGLGYSAMPKVMAHIAAGHMSLVFAVSWMPWLLWTVERGLMTSESNRSVTRRISLTALMWAMIFLADVRWGVYAGGVLVVWWLARGRRQIQMGSEPQSGLGSRLRPFASLWPCIGLFLFLTAILWFPLAEFVLLSPRLELTIEDTALFSLPPSYLVGLLVPNVGGFQEYMTYFGLVLLALAC
ncbi:MAG TPA: hypothetical protein VI547_12650, partial [Anaerolineales bacterium]|nr:hypothetical protein [Anaerolineales bacterium]